MDWVGTEVLAVVRKKSIPTKSTSILVKSGALLEPRAMPKKAGCQRSPIHDILTDDDRFSDDRRIYDSGRNQLQSGIMVGLNEVCREYGLFSCNVERRDVVLAEAVGLFSGPQNQANAVDRGGPSFSRLLVQVVQLKRITGDVKPETLIRWHRKGFKFFWRRKSRMRRPGLRGDIRELIVRR